MLDLYYCILLNHFKVIELAPKQNGLSLRNLESSLSQAGSNPGTSEIIRLCLNIARRLIHSATTAGRLVY